MGASVSIDEAPRISPLSDATAWDNIIRRHENATIFHSSAWFRVLYDTYGYEPCCLVIDEPEPTVIALMEVDSWLTGRRGVGLPFTDFCPTLLGRSVERTKLWQQVLNLAQKRGWRYIELREFPNHLIDSEHAPSLTFYQHVLTLDRDPEKLQARLESSTRRAVKKAVKCNITVAFERGEKAIRDYYRLHCITRQKHGLPPQPFRFFQNIHRHIIEPGRGFVALARKGADPLAGAIFFQFGSWAIYKFGASDPKADPSRPSNAVMWQSITHLCQTGIQHLDFGRTSLQNEGLRRYKLGWGTAEVTKHYFKWSVRDGAPVREKDNAHGIHNRFFRYCPKPLSRAVGNILYRHIA